MAEVAGQGIGARVRRKEDSRFLRGRGNYVSDMVLPGQSEVAFLRSPIAHGRIRRIAKPLQVATVGRRGPEAIVERLGAAVDQTVVVVVDPDGCGVRRAHAPAKAEDLVDQGRDLSFHGGLASAVLQGRGIIPLPG